MATAPEIIESLNTDLAMEHGAIFQYIVHGALLRESPFADAVKRTAREEMWHFEWLTEAIRDRGGVPTLERADLLVSESVRESMEMDVDTEEGAIDHYERTLALIGDSDPKLRALIARIMDDERYHRFQFYRLALRIAVDGEAAHSASAIIGPADIPVVGKTMVMEYGALLQNLVNKYNCGDCEKAETYFEMAVDDMRHAGWMGSYIGGLGKPVVPQPPIDRVVRVRSVAEAAKQSRANELSARDFYDEQVTAASNPDLKMELERAGHQHGFHRHLLEDLG